MKKHRSWNAATWEGLEAVQRREMEALSFEKKLLWLEQAAKMAKAFSNSCKKNKRSCTKCKN